VTAEQILQPVTLGYPGNHPVEPALQTPDFRALIDSDEGVNTALLDLRHRVDDLSHRVGYRPGCQDHDWQSQ